MIADEIIGQVNGTDCYDVSLSVTDDSIEYDCSYPSPDYPCKHINAFRHTLLSYDILNKTLEEKHDLIKMMNSMNWWLI